MIKKIFLSLIVFMSFQQSFTQESLIVGYLPTYRFEVSDQIDFCKLTHLNICFISPNKKGVFPKVDSLREMLIIIREKNPNIKINISLAGGALLKEEAIVWKKFVDIPKNRPILIKSIIDYVEKYNFDGVDMDLEWRNVTKGYSPFVIELKKALVEKNKAFTVAFPAIKRYKYVTDEALATFDFINIMAYDESGSWAPKDAKQHSSYEFAEKSIFFWRDIVGIPAEKLTLGLPFYAYDFRNPNRTKSFKFKEIVAMHPDSIYQDSIGKIYYNGIPTIKKKVEFATKTVAGVMVWELGQDSTDQFSLLTAIHHKIKELGANNTLSDCDISKKDLYAFGLKTFKESIVFKTLEKEKLFSITTDDLKNVKVEVFNKKGRKIKLRTYKKYKTRYYRTRKLWKGTYVLKISNDKYSFKKKLILAKKKKYKKTGRKR